MKSTPTIVLEEQSALLQVFQDYDAAVQSYTAAKNDLYIQAPALVSAADASLQLHMSSVGPMNPLDVTQWLESCTEGQELASLTAVRDAAGKRSDVLWVDLHRRIHTHTVSFLHIPVIADAYNQYSIVLQRIMGDDRQARCSQHQALVRLATGMIAQLTAAAQSPPPVRKTRAKAGKYDRRLKTLKTNPRRNTRPHE